MSDNIIDRIRNHDFYYNYSDDHGVWERGNRSENALINELAALIPSNAVFLIESYVPKSLHENFARRVTDGHAKLKQEGKVLV